MSTTISRATDDIPGVCDAVARMKALEPVDVAFAASLDRTAGVFILGQFVGVRTNRLHGLVSRIDHGLGGKSIQLARPVCVIDYVDARGISHQHDYAVAGEGLRAVFAVPVQVGGTVRGVVYGASRRPVSFGDRLLNSAVDCVAEATRSALPDPADAVETLDEVVVHPTLADLQEVHAELRVITASVHDQVLRERLQSLGEKLCRSCYGGGVELPVRLSPRELDVLAEVAVGCGNAEIAKRLGLTVETIKSYLKSAMGKLGSHSRVEAVHRARRAGQLL